MAQKLRVLYHSHIVEIYGVDVIITDRYFVKDLVWYWRFAIWLFPRMFHLEQYP